jgi:uncharacterized membrane protein
MNFPATALPTAVLWLAHVLYALILIAALWRAPWVYLKNNQDTHVLFGSYVSLYLFWRIGVSLQSDPGLEFHFLLVTTVTLMFGWAFAVIGSAVAQLALTLEGQAHWGSYTLNTLCNGVIPVLFTYYAYRVIATWFPRHFFIYIYLGAFFTGAFALLVSRGFGMILLVATGVYNSHHITQTYAVLLPVMMFPEAFLNGALMTLLVVFRPHWVSSFNDNLYLRGK